MVYAERGAALQSKYGQESDIWADAHITLARRLWEMGQSGAALSTLDGILTHKGCAAGLSPDIRSRVHRLRGSVMLRLERYDDALAAINRGLLDAGYIKTDDDSMTFSLMVERSLVHYRMGKMSESYKDI